MTAYVPPTDEERAQWARDDRRRKRVEKIVSDLAVEKFYCRPCQTEPGEPCRTASGHVKDPHQDRLEMAALSAIRSGLFVPARKRKS